MPAITCLLFDLGGVLIRNTGLERLRILLPTSIETETLKTKLLVSPSFRAFELGLSSPTEFAHAFVSELELNCMPEAFIAEFESWPKGFYAGAEELLAQLRPKYKVACLSNSNALHWARFDPGAHFDVALSSHLLQLVKPDVAVFRRAIQECRVDAAEVLFFDDALVNVAAARACGIESVHVSGFEDVVRELNARRFLQPDA